VELRRRKQSTTEKLCTVAAACHAMPCRINIANLYYLYKYNPTLRNKLFCMHACSLAQCCVYLYNWQLNIFFSSLLYFHDFPLLLTSREKVRKKVGNKNTSRFFCLVQILLLLEKVRPKRERSFSSLFSHFTCHFKEYNNGK